MMPTAHQVFFLFFTTAQFHSFCRINICSEKSLNKKEAASGWWKPSTIWKCTAWLGAHAWLSDDIILAPIVWGGSFFPSGVAVRDGQQIPRGQWKGLSLEELPVKSYLQISGAQNRQASVCACLCVCVFVSGTGWDGCRLTAATCSHAGKFTHGSRCVTSLISSFSHWPGPWFVCRIRWWVMAPARLSSPSVRDSSHSLLHSLTITWRPKKAWHHLPTKAFFFFFFY